MATSATCCLCRAGFTISDCSCGCHRILNPDDNYEIGYSDGWEQGYEEGYEEGYRKAWEEFEEKVTLLTGQKVTKE